MNRLTRYRRWLKFGALRHLPGRTGRRFIRKYMSLLVPAEFEKAIRRSEGMTCIDLGANIGEITRKMASGTKRVVAFEPDPWAFAALHRNVGDLDNVEIQNAAAGTTGGTVLLYRRVGFDDDPAFNSQSSSIVANKSNVTQEGAIEVRQIDFIGYLEDLDEDIGVLKMDIEGAEVDLLESLFDRPDILKRIDYIFAETHETRIPGHQPRVEALRERARLTKNPRVNLYWH